MSQFPPPGQPTQPAYQMQPTQSNGWGIAALITGIASFCVPFIGGLLAVLFGFLGIKRSKVTRSGGALSIVGLILGILSIGMYVLFGGTFYALMRGTAPNRDAAKQLVQDLTAGNMTAVQADTDGSIPQDELQLDIDALKPHGNITDVTCPMTSVTASGGAHVVGVASFSDNTKQAFEADEVKSGDKWKISKFVLNH